MTKEHEEFFEAVANTIGNLKKTGTFIDPNLVELRTLNIILGGSLNSFIEIEEELSEIKEALKSMNEKEKEE